MQALGQKYVNSHIQWCPKNMLNFNIVDYEKEYIYSIWAYVCTYVVATY